MTLRPQIFIDLDVSGTFTSTEEISSDVMGVTWQRGGEPDQAGALAGSATILVADDCGNYCPDNVLSKFGSGIMGVGLEVRITTIYQGTTYAAFRGRINRLTPEIGVKGEQLASLFCVDAMEELGPQIVNHTITGNATGGVAIGSPDLDRVALTIGSTIGAIATLLDQVGWADARAQITETGRTLNIWWVYDETIKQQFDKLLFYEGPGSEIYINSSGSLTFHSSTHRVGAVALSTFTNSLQDWAYTWSLRNMLNVAELTVHPTGGLISGSTLGSLNTAGLSASSGSTLFRTAALSGAPVLSLTMPVGGKDGAGQFAVVSTVDGSSNVAGLCTVTGRVLGHSLMELKFRSLSTDAWRIQAPEGAASTLTTAAIVGSYPVDANAVVSSSNAASITKYGRRVVIADLVYNQSCAIGGSLAADIVTRYATPLPDYSRATIIGSDTVSIPQVLTLDIGDMIEVTVARLGVASVNYFITAGEWTMNPDGKTVQAVYSLEKQ